MRFFNLFVLFKNIKGTLIDFISSFILKMFSITDFLPQVNLSDDLADLISFQIESNHLLHKPTLDKFAIIGIYLPDDSIIKPCEPGNKFEFAISVAAEMSSRISDASTTAFTKKFPLLQPSQPALSPGKLVVKLNGKNKPDLSIVTEDDDLTSVDVGALSVGNVVLVEGSFKPYHISSTNSVSGTLLEFNSMIILGTSETNNVASPTKRKLKEYLNNRKLAKLTN